MHDNESLRVQAGKIRASNVLGRSTLLQRLFDFLVECSIQGRAPKEIELAIDVFGKGPDFDVSQDAVIRVYIHKLRRKLEEFYAGPGRQETARVIIPKGEYRFALEHMPPDAPSAADTIPPPRRPWLPWLAGVLAATVLAHAGLLFMNRAAEPVTPDLQGVRDNPVWSRLLDDELPIFVVVGDYYIFGETDEHMNVRRMVREFDVNSRGDLDRKLQNNPELADRYMNLDLAYLPTASAFALRDLMPVLAPKNRRIGLVLMSSLTPSMMKSAHIVYVGYLSGMGLLRDFVFAGSRFSVGETYDEIVDRQDGHTYVSQAGSPVQGETMYHDYGYVSTFAGPNGNQIVVIAGTRDVAVMHAAEVLTDTPKLQGLTSRIPDAQAFEALYEVDGINRMNLDGKLLTASALDTARIWKGDTGVIAQTP